MFCPNCGTPNTDESRFCENCGHPLTEDVCAEAIPQPEPPVIQKNSPPKLLVAVIAEAAVLVLILTAFIAIGSMRSSADAVAKEYIQAYMKEDWEKCYTMTDAPSGKHLQKEQYINCMKASERPEIINYNLTEDPSLNNPIQKGFLVEYTAKGQNGDTFPIVLTKQKEKTMLFFDNWKVSSTSDVVNDFPIYVPSGSSVTIDGVLLAKEELYKNDTGDVIGSVYETDMDCYHVSLFSGTHTIQVSLPWFELYTKDFNVSAGDAFFVTDMKLMSNSNTAVSAKMQKVLKTFYQSAVMRKDFSAVEDLFLEEYKESGKEIYEELKDNLSYSDSFTLSNVNFHTFNCTAKMEDTTGMIDATLDCAYDMKYLYTYYSYWDGMDISEEKTDSGNFSMNASFGYDGKDYKLAFLSIRSIL